MGALRDQRHALADPDGAHLVAHRVDVAPALVAGLAGRERIREPLTAFVHRELGGTDARALQLHAHLAASGLGHRDLTHDHPARRLQNGSAHAGYELRLTASTRAGLPWASSSHSYRRAIPDCTETRGFHPVRFWNAEVSET